MQSPNAHRLSLVVSLAAIPLGILSASCGRSEPPGERSLSAGAAAHITQTRHTAENDPEVEHLQSMANSAFASQNRTISPEGQTALTQFLTAAVQHVHARDETVYRYDSFFRQFFQAMASHPGGDGHIDPSSLSAARASLCPFFPIC